MIKNIKILIAGVGGQGVVFLSNLVVEAAMISNIPVSVSEIHGLSQRGGVVTSGIGLGAHCTGFIGKASVDFLFGLEPLETQRCLSYLHKNSSVIFGHYRIQPYSVNAEITQYPELSVLATYLEKQCKEAVFIKEFAKHIDPILYNVFMLGRASRMNDFPFQEPLLEAAINNTLHGTKNKETMDAFKLGVAYEFDKKQAPLNS